MNELHRLRNGGINVVLSSMLPANTMMVSQDVWDSLKKAGKTPETIEGEIVKEAQRQLEGGDEG